MVFLFGLIIGLGAGWVSFSIYPDLNQKEAVEAGSDSITVPPHEFALDVGEDGLPSAADVNRFTDTFILPGDDGQVMVSVIGLSQTAVAVILTEIIAKDGRDGNHRRIVVMDMQSFEPAFIWLQNGKRCWIQPETTWGGVHRHTGLGASMSISDD